MSTLRLLLDVIRKIPKALPMALNQWVMDMHRGWYVDADIGWVCLGPAHPRGITTWPCSEYKMAADRNAEIEARA